MSYSKFIYRLPKLGATEIKAGDSLTVTAEIRNLGGREGDEVAEVYVVPPQNGVSPRMELEGFQRIHLHAGDMQRVQFTLSPRQLSEVDEKGNRAVAPGDYSIYVAGSQPEPGTPAAKVHITGTVALPR